jgi:hypothetical protein
MVQHHLVTVHAVAATVMASFRCAALDTAFMLPRPRVSLAVLRRVQLPMFGVRHHLKIRDVVVGSVPVDVVNNLVGRQAASQVRFHDKPMFAHVPLLGRLRMLRLVDLNVSMTRSDSPADPCRVLLPCAGLTPTRMRAVAASAALHLVFLCKECFATGEAGTLYRHRTNLPLLRRGRSTVTRHLCAHQYGTGNYTVRRRAA